MNTTYFAFTETLKELDDNIWANMDFIKFPMKSRKTIKEEKAEKRKIAKEKRAEAKRKYMEEHEISSENKTDLKDNNFDDYVTNLRNTVNKGTGKSSISVKETNPTQGDKQNNSKPNKISTKSVTKKDNIIPPKKRGRPPKNK